MPGSAAPPPTIDRAASRFLLIYAVANAGGVIAFLPLLTMLLPLKVESIAGEARLGVLTASVIAGAIAASLSNVAFGWLSDRSVARGDGRRRWVAGGVVATALAYLGLAAADSSLEIVLAVVVFQLALNAVLAPLFAIMADEVPDGRKGVAGGLLALANPLASGVSAILVGASVRGDAARFAIVPAIAAACIAPLLLTRATPAGGADPVPARRRILRRDLAIVWSARLLIQIAGSVLFGYLLYYFESIVPDAAGRELGASVGHLMTIAYIVPLPVAVLIGRLSDRTGARKPFLFAAAIVAALGLSGMSVATDWTTAAVAFGLYATGSSVFLSLHSAFAMQLLPDPRRRGRDLGLLNLTNTLPALIGPLLAWMLATPRDFDVVMLSLAALALCGGGTILAARGGR